MESGAREVECKEEGGVENYDAEEAVDGHPWDKKECHL